MSPSGVETIIGNLPKQKLLQSSHFLKGLIDFDNNVAFMNLSHYEFLT